MEFFVDKERGVVVSGRSLRNPIKNKEGKIVRYDNPDIWSEDWADEFCFHPPIIHPAKVKNKNGYFARNKLIARDSEILLAFIPKGQYRSGTWNTVKHFILKPDFNIDNLYIYDQFGRLWELDQYPFWIQAKLKMFNTKGIQLKIFIY